MIALRIDEASKSFGSLRAVDGLSLQISRGETFGLLGSQPGLARAPRLACWSACSLPTKGPYISKPARAGHRARLPRVGKSASLRKHCRSTKTMTALENLRFFGKLYGLHGAAPQRADRMVLGL